MQGTPRRAAKAARVVPVVLAMAAICALLPPPPPQWGMRAVSAQSSLSVAIYEPPPTETLYTGVKNEAGTGALTLEAYAGPEQYHDDLSFTWSKESGPGEVDWQGTEHDVDGGYSRPTFLGEAEGIYTVRVEASSEGETDTATSSDICVMEADVDVEGISDPLPTSTAEAEPGCYMKVGGPRKQLTLSVAASAGMWHRTTLRHQNGVRIYESETGGQPLTDLTWWGLGEVPETLYVDPSSPEDGSNGATRLELYGADYQNSGEARDRIIFRVVDVDLDAEGVAEGDEQDPGVFIPLNDNDSDEDDIVDLEDPVIAGNDPDLVGLTVRFDPTSNQFPEDDEVTLTWTGTDKVALYEEKDKSNPVSSGVTIPVNELSETYYIEGVEASGELRDIEFTLEFDMHGVYCTDTVKASVVDVKKIPLGFSAELTGCTVGQVYVPTYVGGHLELSGGNCSLYYQQGDSLDFPDARRVLNDEYTEKASGSPCDYDVPEGQFQWYWVRLNGAGPTSITSKFTQTDTITKEPWPCPWYPMAEDNSPNLYEAGGPLDKYDTAYNTNSVYQEKDRGDYTERHYTAAGTLNEQNAEQTVGYDFDNADGDGDEWTGWDLSVAYDFWHEASNWWGHDGATSSTEDASWWGHCTEASAAIVCEDEPTGNYQEGGVTFTPADKKGLLVALYHGGTCTEAGPDIQPHAWQSSLESWAVRNGWMFVSDICNVETGYDVIWHYPICHVDTELWEDDAYDDEKILKVDCHIRYWHSSADGQSGSEQSREYSYRLTYNHSGAPVANQGVNDWLSGEEYNDAPDSAWLPNRQTSVNWDWWVGELDYDTLATIVPLD